MDRALATMGWLNIFPNYRLYNIISTNSDHTALYLCLFSQTGRRMQSRFRFENVWLEDLGCATTVECSFLYHHNSNIYDKIVKCTAELQRWGERKVKNLHHQLNEAKLQMEAYMGCRDNMGATTFEKYKHK